jgi:hypothetical protein
MRLAVAISCSPEFATCSHFAPVELASAVTLTLRCDPLLCIRYEAESLLSPPTRMTLRERIDKIPCRTILFGLGLCFTLSCLSLLGEGFDHLRFFVPGAAVNLIVGAFASERIARAVLIIESCVIFGLCGYEILTYEDQGA